MIEIQLTKGYVALIDDDDYARVAAYKWQVKQCSCANYAMAHTRGPNSSRTTIYMHRVIIGAKPGEDVDHRDGNGLDNRRANLRIASGRQNHQNQTHKRTRTSSRFKGVFWREDRSKWRAQIGAGPIRANGLAKTIHLGNFACEEDAARAYDAAARRLFGEFASTNFKV